MLKKFFSIVYYHGKEFLCFVSKVFTFATQARGSKQYELTDHLGNIRTVVPDIKEPLSLPQNQNFRLPTLTLNNYYPYGMLQAGRSRNAGGYRFGFNGMEQTKGVQGNSQGTFYDYKNRDYDPWKIRFNRVDLLASKFPYYSTYQFAGNTPIAAIDLDGAEEKIVITQMWTTTQTNTKYILKNGTSKAIQYNTKVTHQANTQVLNRNNITNSTDAEKFNQYANVDKYGHTGTLYVAEVLDTKDQKEFGTKAILDYDQTMWEKIKSPLATMANSGEGYTLLGKGSSQDDIGARKADGIQEMVDISDLIDLASMFRDDANLGDLMKESQVEKLMENWEKMRYALMGAGYGVKAHVNFSVLYLDPKPEPKPKIDTLKCKFCNRYVITGDPNRPHSNTPSKTNPDAKEK